MSLPTLGGPMVKQCRSHTLLSGLSDLACLYIMTQLDLSSGGQVPPPPPLLPPPALDWARLMLVSFHRIGLSQLEGFRRQLLDVLQRSTKPKVSPHQLPDHWEVLAVPLVAPH